MSRMDESFQPSMYLGRCFLLDEHEVGKVWAEYKAHPRLMCSIQDDDFTSSFRE